MRRKGFAAEVLLIIAMRAPRPDEEERYADDDDDEMETDKMGMEGCLSR
jgi:surfactin synthase thioesterase subunit